MLFEVKARDYKDGFLRQSLWRRKRTQERKISNDDQPSCSSRAHSRGSGRPALEQNREILTIRRFPEASEQNVSKVIVIDLKYKKLV